MRRSRRPSRSGASSWPRWSWPTRRPRRSSGRVATWVAVLESLPQRQPILQRLLRGTGPIPTRHLSCAISSPQHYRAARSRVAALVAQSLGDGSSADDPRCRAIATFVIAACDGLSIQWLLDPSDAPSPAELLDGLTVVWDASRIR